MYYIIFLLVGIVIFVFVIENWYISLPVERTYFAFIVCYFLIGVKDLNSKNYVYKSDIAIHYSDEDRKPIVKRQEKPFSCLFCY